MMITYEIKDCCGGYMCSPVTVDVAQDDDGERLAIEAAGLLYPAPRCGSCGDNEYRAYEVEEEVQP